MDRAQEILEDREAAIEKLENQRELAKSMGRLLDNEDFQKVLETRFIEDYALSQMANLADYNQTTREIVMEKMIARSVFKTFIDDTIQTGMIAVDQLTQIDMEDKFNEQDNLEE